MSTAAVPASASEAVRMLHCGLGMVRSAAGFLAVVGAADLPAETLAEGLRALESTDAVGAAVRGLFLEAFDAQDGPVADGQRTVRTWLVHSTRVTKGQAAEHRAVQTLAAICAEIRYRAAPPDPDDEKDKHLDRGVSFDTTFDGAGVIHGDLTPGGREGPGHRLRRDDNPGRGGRY